MNESEWVLKLWGKTDKTNEDLYHPLLFHMMDVAAVAGVVWDQVLTSGLRKRLECSLGTGAGSQVVFLSGAHDIGKASPGFQGKVPDLSRQLDGFLNFSENDINRPHGFISTHVLNEALGSCQASAVLAQVAGGHHGVFPRSAELRMGRDTLGNNSWKVAREELLREFVAAMGLVGLDDVTKYESEITDPAVVPILAGFISIVDWIGSNQDFFPCVAERGNGFGDTPENYWKDAQEKARKALEKLGWLPAVTFADEARFDEVFRDFTPNALQEVAIELASERNSPYLMIVEALMGSGKTEAALYAADLAMCRGFARGMYVAMPTQATGNAMFRRVLHGYLKHRGHQGKLNLQLVHGDALLAQTAEVKEGEIADFEPRDIGDEGDVEAQSWFTAKKRPLLAPFGVGTIDQSLLSVLQTKHWFVRLFGLAGKVVIFDEVHAYDAYMSTILERLLRWLAEVGCTVILLSATLPEAKRKALVRAYSGSDDLEHKHYPRIALAAPRRYPNEQANKAPLCREVPIVKPREFKLGFSATGLESLSGLLGGRLQNGGCAAVICNTVNRSIEVYKYLRDNLKDTECSLFHARTLRMWRREREEEVLRRFGKLDPQEKDEEGRFLNPDRPFRAVLVATQVIEQSLDLDFDLMVSEIAPIDLLLQRLGRLHRHPRPRPAGLETPRFIVLCDAETAGPPPESFGKSIEYIYDRYILLRTWLVLRERDRIEIPNEIETLVEAVYGPECSDADVDWSNTLAEAKERMERSRNESEKAAGKLLVDRPGSPGDLIETFNDQLVDEEDPEVHRTVRAATREGDPSITVVMLPEDTVLAADPGVSDVRKLLDKSVKLSHRGIFRLLLDEGESAGEWAKNAHLRHARLLRMDERNQGLVGNYVLTVDEKLGIVIEKEGEKHG